MQIERQQMATKAEFNLSRSQEGRELLASDVPLLHRYRATIEAALQVLTAVAPALPSFLDPDEISSVDERSSIFEALGRSSDETSINTWTRTFRTLRGASVNCQAAQTAVRSEGLLEPALAFALAGLELLKGECGESEKEGCNGTSGSNNTASLAFCLHRAVLGCLQFLVNAVTGNEANQALVWKWLCHVRRTQSSSSSDSSNSGSIRFEVAADTSLCGDGAEVTIAALETEETVRPSSATSECVLDLLLHSSRAVNDALETKDSTAAADSGRSRSSRPCLAASVALLHNCCVSQHQASPSTQPDDSTEGLAGCHQRLFEFTHNRPLVSVLLRLAATQTPTQTQPPPSSPTLPPPQQKPLTSLSQQEEEKEERKRIDGAGGGGGGDDATEWIVLLLGAAAKVKGLLNTLWTSCGAGGEARASLSFNKDDDKSKEDDDEEGNNDENGGGGEGALILVTAEQLVLANVVNDLVTSYWQQQSHSSTKEEKNDDNAAEEKEEEKAAAEVMEKEEAIACTCEALVDILTTFPSQQKFKNHARGGSGGGDEEKREDEFTTVELMHHRLNEEGRSIILGTLISATTLHTSAKKTTTMTAAATNTNTNSTTSASSNNKEATEAAAPPLHQPPSFLSSSSPPNQQQLLPVEGMALRDRLVKAGLIPIVVDLLHHVTPQHTRAAVPPNQAAAAGGGTTKGLNGGKSQKGAAAVEMAVVAAAEPAGAASARRAVATAEGGGGRGDDSDNRRYMFMAPEGRRVALTRLAANLSFGPCKPAQDAFRLCTRRTRVRTKTSPPPRGGGGQQKPQQAHMQQQLQSQQQEHDGQEEEGEDGWGLAAVLNQCNLDKEDSRPGSAFLREWGIFAVRNLCDASPLNQSAVDALVPQAMANAPQAYCTPKQQQQPQQPIPSPSPSSSPSSLSSSSPSLPSPPSGKVGVDYPEPSGAAAATTVTAATAADSEVAAALRVRRGVEPALEIDPETGKTTVRLRPVDP